MASKARVGIFAGIDNEFAPSATGVDMPAAGAVARFAANFTGHRQAGKGDFLVRTGAELSRNVGMTIEANPVADVVRAGNLQRRHGNL